MLLTPAQIKPKSFRSRRNFFFSSSFFLSFSLGADAPHVYVRAWTLCCFHSHIGTQAFRRALTASVHGQPRGDKEFPFSGVTSSGRVWSKVPESDIGSVVCFVTVSESARTRYFKPTLRNGIHVQAINNLYAYLWI